MIDDILVVFIDHIGYFVFTFFSLILLAAIVLLLVMKNIQRKKREIRLLRSEAELRRTIDEKTKDIREIEERFRSAFEDAVIGMAITDISGRFLRVNRAFIRMTGYADEQLLALSFRDISHPDDFGIELPGFERLLNGEQDSCQLEKRCLHKAGRVIWVSLGVSVVRDESGGPHYFIVQAEDITNRKNAEAELNLQQNRVQQYLEIAGVMIVVIGVDQKVVLINRKGAEVLGYSKEEIVGRNWFDSFVPERERDNARADFRRLICADIGNVEYFENTVSTRSGSEKLIAWHHTVIRNEQGKIVSTLSSGDDITDKRRAEEEIRRSREKFWKIFKFSPLSIAIATKDDGRFIEVNDAFLAMFGYGKDEVLGKTSLELSLIRTGEDREKVVQMIDESGRVAMYEQRLYGKSDNPIDVLLYGEPVTLGNQECVLWHAIDITQRKAMEQQLRDARKAAETANLAKSRFLASMSHDIRTPLNAIIGLAELAQETGDERLQKEYVDMVRKSGEILLHLVNDVMDMSKIEAGKFELESKVFNFEEIVRDCVEPLAHMARQKGLSFVIKLPPGLPDFNGSVTGLRKIITNIVGNAVKFTTSGTVTLCADKVEEDAGKVLMSITVSDTGKGIPEEFRARIFESFSQAEPVIDRVYGGSGLGTAISKQLTEMMGGRIWYESYLGKGTEFFIELPFVKSIAALRVSDAEKNENARIREGKRSLNVLYAEDNYYNQRVLADSLKTRGHKVTVASDGKRAFELWSRGAYDLVLLDLRMPGMDGYEVARQIRESEKERGGRVPIVAVTADVMSEDRSRCLEAGMDEYMSKPVKLGELFRKLGRCLPVQEDAGDDTAAAGRSDEEGLAGEFNKDSLPIVIMSNAAVLAEYARMLVDDISSGIARIEESLNAGDMTALVTAAHTLKGVCVHLRSPLMKELAADIEAKAAEAEEPFITDTLASLRREYDKLVSRITGKQAGSRE